MVRGRGERIRPPQLAPALGRRLPRALLAGRVGREAAALEGGVRGPGFASLIERIDDDVFHAGLRVETYFDGAAAFEAMLAAVDAAKQEVLLESYIFKDDPTGRRFQEALIAAARRGATVRVLADGVGSFETRRAFWQEMERGGVQARMFRPVTFPFRLIYRRDHRKILVADRRVAFTGGMNIGDEYGSSLLPTGQVWRDTHARVEGSAAWEMAVVFEEAWKESGGDPLGLAACEVGPAADPRVLVLDSRPGRGQQEVSAIFASIAGGARETLWITVAYFAPRRRGLRILGAAAARGVDVRLLLPGLTDVALVRHAGHGFYTDLLRRGVRIFEYRAAVLHAKTLVADGYLSVVGSSNLDFRSFELNGECNFVILDDATGARMRDRFEDDLTRAEEIRLPAWRQRGRLHRFGDQFSRRLAPLL